jgi:hypothetical protein
MNKADCREDMRVIFGRARGEKTVAKVVKLNPKKAVVQTLQDRPRWRKGTLVRVAYEMMEPAPASANDIPDVPNFAAPQIPAPSQIGPGTTFNSTYADGNPEWTVIKKTGSNWLCRIEADADWQGTEKVFMPSEIRQAAAMQAMFARSQDDTDAFYASLEPGQIIHYNNGFENYVRCEAVEVDGKMKLKPIALVGKWSSHDLPSRRPNGDIYLGYYAQMIADGKTFDPNVTCLYESGACRGSDPTKWEPLDLTVPKMTPKEDAQAKLWRVVEAGRAALDAGDDPKTRLQIAYAALHEYRWLFLDLG